MLKAASSAANGDPDDESADPQPPRPGTGTGARTVRAGQARRGSVFVEPVVLEAGWVPPVRALPRRADARCFLGNGHCGSPSAFAVPNVP